MDFEDIYTNLNESCLFCNASLTNSPWKICFDLKWVICTRAYLCQECAERIFIHGCGLSPRRVKPDSPVYDGVYFEALNHMGSLDSPEN